MTAKLHGYGTPQRPGIPAYTDYRLQITDYRVLTDLGGSLFSFLFFSFFFPFSRIQYPRPLRRGATEPGSDRPSVPKAWGPDVEKIGLPSVRDDYYY